MEKEVKYCDGNQPVIHVCGRTSAEVWQQAMIDLWDFGLDVPTSFDRPGDPKSKDATVIMQVDEPFAEPRIPKNYPGGFEALEWYRLEVTHGVHDHWVERYGTKWNYTYHERLRAYDVGDGKKIDQLKNLTDLIVGKVEKARKEGKEMDITNRRFQIITWIPSVDPFIIDPPCLQRVHIRILPTDDSKQNFKLNMNTDWRSRDGYKASFMNMYALTEDQRLIAKELSERTGLNIGVGRYCDKSDSLHIYGKDFYGANPTFEAFYKRAKKLTLEQMTFSEDYQIENFKNTIIEARRLLAAQLDWEKKTGNKGTFDPNLTESDIRANYSYPKEWDK